MNITQPITRRANTRVTTMATASMKLLSTPGKDSGRCCVPGCGLVEASRKKSCRSISLSSHSSTTFSVEARRSCHPCSLSLWLIETHIEPKQYVRIDEQADLFVSYLYGLSNKEALQASGVLAKQFWLRDILSKYF
jgi:hypothetical protein